MATSAFLEINPEVRFVGVSKLRDLNATKLREQTDAIVIQDNDKPLSVLFSYKRYLAMREEFQTLMSMVELLSSPEEHKGVLASFEDLRAGRVRSLSDIEADLDSE